MLIELFLRQDLALHNPMLIELNPFFFFVRIYDRLKYCACSFMLEHVQFKTKSEEVFKRTRIEINNLPPPNRFVFYLKIIATPRFIVH